MHTETERKFIVKNEDFRAQATESHRISQGYIAHDGGNTVRVRILDKKGILTIKGPSNGISRAEWEIEIPLGDAEELMLLTRSGRIEKTRHIVPAKDSVRYWEIDEFRGDNEGLIMAEIELGSEDESFDKPSWLGEEVTGDPRYYNSYLSKVPFKSW